MALKVGELFAELNVKDEGFNKGLSKAGKTFGDLSGSVLKGMAGLKILETTLGAVKDGLASTINAGKSFESAMSQVAATMNKTVDQISDLNDFALKMGSTTQFTATQAAEALNYMALAGYDSKKSMEVLPSVMDLAAAGAMDLARASDMVTDTETAFGMSTERTAQMVDEMAKAASTGNTSVEQLGDAFLVVGGLAQELNGGMVTLKNGSKAGVDGIQELEIALTAMANAGVKGSEAGTHMRNMLLKLSSPTSEGTKALEAMGVNVFDAAGRMRSLSDIFGDLNTAMGAMTQEGKIQAISDLFNTRDLASAEALLKAVGSDWDRIGESILDADGAARKMAETQLDNLSGDITLLKSSVEGFQIAIYKSMNGALRSATKGAKKIVDALHDAFDQGFTPEALSNVIDVAFDVLDELGGQLGKGVLDLTEAFVISVPTLSKKLSLGLGNALKGLSGRLPKLFGDISQAIPDMIMGAGHVAGEIADTLFAALNSAIVSLGAMLPRIAPALLSAFANVMVHIGDGIMSVVNTLVDGLMNGFSIEEIRKKISVQLDTEVTEGDEGSGEDPQQQIETAIANKMGETFAAVKEAMTNGKLADDAEAGVKAAEEFGSQIGDLRKGIDDWETGKIDAIKASGGSQEEIDKQIGEVQAQADTMRRSLDTAQVGFDQYLEDSVEKPTKQAKKAGENLDGILTSVTDVETQLGQAMAELGESLTPEETPETGDSLLKKITDDLLGGELDTEAISAKFEGLADAILGGITTGLAGLGDSAVGIAQSIAKLISTGLDVLGDSEINFDTLGDKILTALTTSIQTLVADATQISQILSDLIGKAIETVTGEEFTGKVDTLAGDILTALETSMTTLIAGATNIAGILTDLIGKGIDAVTDEGFIGAVDGLADKIFTTLTTSIGKIGDGATQIVGKLGELLGKALEDLGDEKFGAALTGLGTTLIDGIVSALAKAQTNGVRIFNKITEIINENLTPEKLKAVLTNATTFAQGIFDAITDGITTLGDGEKNVADALLGAIGSLIENLGDEQVQAAYVSFATTIINGLGDTLVNNIERLGDLGVKLANGIGTVLGKIGEGDFGDSLTKVASTLISKLGQVIGQTIKSGEDIALAVAQNIGTALGSIGESDFGSNLETVAKTLIDTLFNTLNSLITSGGTIAKTVAESIGAALGKIAESDFGSNLMSIGETFVKSLFSTIGTLIETGSGVTVDIVGGIGTLLGKIGPESFTNLGDFAATFIKGLGNAIRKAFDSAGDIVDAISELLFKPVEDGEVGDGTEVSLSENMLKGLSGMGEQIIGAIAEGIHSAGTGAVDFIGAIGTMLANALNDGSLIGNLGAFGESIISSLAQGILQAGNTAGQILSAIGTAISSIEWDQVGADLANLAGGLLDSLVNAITNENTDFTGVMTSIGAGLGNAAGALAGAAVKIAGQFVNYLLNPANWIPLGKGIVSILEGIFAGIFAFVDEFTGGLLTDTTEEKVESLTQSTDTLTELSQAADEASQSATGIDSMGRSLGEIQSFSDAQFAALTSDILNLSQADLTGIGSGISETIGAISSGAATAEELDSLTESLTNYKAVIDAINDSGLAGGLNTGEYDLMQLIGYGFDPENIDLNSEEIYQALSDLIQGVLDNPPEPVEAEIPVEGEPVAEESPSGPQGIDFESYITESMGEDGVEFDVPVTPTAEITGVEVTEGEGTGFQEATQAVVDQLIAEQNFSTTVNVSAAVNVAISENNASAIGDALGNDLGTAFATAVGNATSSVATAAAKLTTTAVQNLVGGAGRAYSIGANFGQGFANGIASKIDAVKQAVQRLVQAAIDKANAAQNSGSPSKVTAQIGGWFGQGYTNGISDHIREAANVAANLAESAIGAVSGLGGMASAMTTINGRHFAGPAAVGASASGGMAIDYDRLAYAMSQQPAPSLSMNGREVARINSNNTAYAQNSRMRNIAMRYGRR